MLITHQEESIDSGFARFNTIITSLEALDEGFSSKNYVRKFLRALHSKRRAKVMERVKSIALKAKKESSDDETSTSESDDEEYAMVVRNFKSSLEEMVDLLDSHEKKISHFGKGMIRKAIAIGNTLDAVILIISLANVQSLNEIRIKRRSLEVLGAIVKMKPRTKPMMKLVSWLNRQMRNLFPPLDNPKLTIRRRSRADPTLLNDFEMAAEGNGDPPVPDLRTMKELFQNSCQSHGLSGDDANKYLDKFLHVTQSIKVNGVTDDALRLYLFPHSLTHHAIDWFDRLQRNSINTFEQMAKIFLEKYFPPFMVTKLINEIANFRQRPDESLFEAWEHYKLSIDRCPNHNMLAVTQIDTFYNGLTLRHRDTINAAAGGTFMKRRPEECYDLIENMTAHHKDWDMSAQRNESSSSITSSFDQEIVALKVEMAEINKNLMRVLQVYQQVKAVTPSCETCGGPHSYNDCPTTVGQTQNGNNQGRNQFFQGASHGQNPPPAYQAPAYQAPPYQAPGYQAPENDAILKIIQTNMTSLINSNLELKNMFGHFASSSGSGTLLGNTVTNPKEDLKGITTRSGTAYQIPTIPTTSSSLPQVVERETEVTKDTVPPTNNGSTKDIQPPVVQTKTPKSNFEPAVTPIIEPVIAPTKRDLTDVFEGELTIRVGKEAITFNLDQTSRYSPNYNDMTANQIHVIDMACEEYSQEVLNFSVVITSDNLTPYYDLIVSTFSPTLTPFGDNVFLLEEVDAFLAFEDDPTSPEGDDKFPVIIAKDLSDEEKTALIMVLKSHKRAIAWKLSDIKGINLEFCTYKILMEEDFEPAVQHQRRVNPKIHDVIKKEVLKHLDAGLLYPISDSPWVSPVHCVPKKGSFTVVENEENELILTRLVTGWRACIDYRKLNEAIRKDHFPLPFMDQMLERLARNEYYCFLNGFSGYFQIPIDLKDQEKTTFTCPYIMFTYRRMPFGLCNAPGTFQRCMMAIFHDMIEKTIEVFMENFSVFGNSFQTCLSHLEKMLKRCEDTNLCLNWEKSHFLVKEGIDLGHKISKNGIEVDKAKINVIAKLPHTRLFEDSPADDPSS
nr:reverse transcriptase domain-containing protein [Tanacetum cinerariifolium]